MVIDFGIAKTMQTRLTELTFFTTFEQMIGTPAYMSPERAELTAVDVDTGSDIYSIGVLLYELLTGRLPIDAATLQQAGLDEIRRLIREVAPPPPSLRMTLLCPLERTSVAERRSAEAARLPGLPKSTWCRGDASAATTGCRSRR